MKTIRTSIASTSAILVIAIMPTIFLSNAARAGILDASLASLVTVDSLPTPLQDGFDEIVARAEAMFGQSIDSIPLRRLVTSDFASSLRRLRVRFEPVFWKAGVPSDLSGNELYLFEHAPQHPLFSDIASVKLPKGFKPHSLAKYHQIYFVIDAVRTMKKDNDLSKRLGYEEFKAAIEHHVGQPLDQIGMDHSGHLAAAAACENGLATYSTKELLLELMRRNGDL